MRAGRLGADLIANVKGRDVAKKGVGSTFAGMDDIETWKQWAHNDGMPEPYISNIRSWSQDQMLALAVQINEEMIDAAPDPQQYPETVEVARSLVALTEREEGEDPDDYSYRCLRMHRFHVQKFVVNFGPHELQGHTWRHLRRNKGPLRFW